MDHSANASSGADVSMIGGEEAEMARKLFIDIDSMMHTFSDRLRFVAEELLLKARREEGDADQWIIDCAHVIAATVVDSLFYMHSRAALDRTELLRESVVFS